MTRIFVAGGTGAIGRRLVPLLNEAGHQVTCSSRTEAGVERLRAQGATGVLLDVLDRTATARAVAAAAPEVVIHQLTSLAAANPADNARIRVTGTRNLVDAALQAGARRIIAQSIAWAYRAGNGPADEKTPLDVDAPEPRAQTVGGIIALEDAVAEIDEHVVLRYGTCYGLGTWYAPGGLMAGKLANGTLQANLGVSSFVHVADAAQAAVLALDWPHGPVNIVDDDPAPAAEWVPVLAAALGEPVPETSEGGAGWERGASNARAHALGWRPSHSTWRTWFAKQD